jgi:predicted TIM-barrel fold metal-dependent hydrolase
VLGTQPAVLPDDPGHLRALLDMVDAERVLVYASDYPHWDFDAPKRSLPAEVPLATRRRILGRNALELYGLAVPEPVAG